MSDTTFKFTKAGHAHYNVIADGVGIGQTRKFERYGYTYWTCGEGTGRNARWACTRLEAGLILLAKHRAAAAVDTAGELAYTDPKRCGCGEQIDDPRFICCRRCR